jgi:hypothetical protein
VNSSEGEVCGIRVALSSSEAMPLLRDWTSSPYTLTSEGTSDVSTEGGTKTEGVRE